MKVVVFDTHAFEKNILMTSNERYGHELHFLDVPLTSHTAALAKGFPCVCAFANDRLDEACLAMLSEGGTELIALRSAGFNHVDRLAAQRLKLGVVRVPEYSPHSVAEHAVALMLALNRKLHKSFSRVRDLNFSLDGLVGFDMYGKTVGIVGTGRIGKVLAKIVNGFGCQVLAYDISPDHHLAEQFNVKYVSLKELFERSHIISLHAPLNATSKYMIDAQALALMKPGVMLINTSRGALIDTKALITALKSGQIGYAGLDVYEEEAGVFFEDHSEDLLKDDVLARLITFPNVAITSHQGFLTKEALSNIAETTLQNISAFERDGSLENAVSLES